MIDCKIRPAVEKKFEPIVVEFTLNNKEDLASFLFELGKTRLSYEKWSLLSELLKEAK